MNIDKLSKRLECVVSYIKKGMSIADIGSDHAYLPCYAINQGLSPYAIAGEVVEGPFQSAKQQVAQAELATKIDVRKGDGLQVIEKNEVDCIIIAGMGGSLITEILENGKEKLVGVTRLILQPNIAAENVRKWLIQHGWDLIDEELIEEDNKFYEILVAEKANESINKRLTSKELLLGPILLKKKHEAFQKKWRQELKQWKNILHQLEKAEEKNIISEKRKDLITKIKIVTEVLE